MSSQPLSRPAARAGARPGARSAPAPAARPVAPLRLVPRAGSHAPRAPFVGLLLLLLVGGIAGMLVLSMSLEQGAFRLAALQTRESTYADRVQELGTQVQAAADPATLAARAERLGMVADPEPAFIRLPSGLVSGDTPLAGRHVHLARVPGDGIWIGPGGPPAPAPVLPPTPAPRSAAEGKHAKTAKSAAHPKSTGHRKPAGHARHHPHRTVGT